jgi:S-adenosylmethionine:tRNA-ribosyltransferase-isomerase (queuine synthetase)
MGKEIQTYRVIATNRTKSPRGINTVGGVVFVEPGHSSKEIVVTEAERQSMSSSGFSVETVGEGDVIVRNDIKVRPTKLGAEVERLRVQVADLTAKLKEQSGESDEVPAKSIDELLAMAEDKSVPFATFKAEVVKVLGEDTPNRKAEMVDALLAKATD